MAGREGKRRCAAARVADEMETSDPVSIRLAQDPGDLDTEVEAERRPIVRVHLEILRDGIDALHETGQR